MCCWRTKRIPTVLIVALYWIPYRLDAVQKTLSILILWNFSWNSYDKTRFEKEHDIWKKCQIILQLFASRALVPLLYFWVSDLCRRNFWAVFPGIPPAQVLSLRHFRPFSALFRPFRPKMAENAMSTYFSNNPRRSAWPLSPSSQCCRRSGKYTFQKTQHWPLGGEGGLR